MSKPELFLIPGGLMLGARMSHYRARKAKAKRTDSADMPIELRGLARRLEEARAIADIGVTALDGLAGVPVGTTSRVEDGQQLVSLENLLRYARVLGVNLHWLITGEGPRYFEFSKPPLLEKKTIA